MATFESMDRRMPKIEACLKANGLESLDACNEMLLAKGIDCDKICLLYTSQGRSLIARFQLLHGLVEPDRRLCGCGPVGGVGGLVAGHPHRVAGAAGRCRVGRIAQQVQSCLLYTSG